MLGYVTSYIIPSFPLPLDIMYHFSELYVNETGGKFFLNKNSCLGVPYGINYCKSMSPIKLLSYKVRMLKYSYLVAK